MESTFDTTDDEGFGHDEENLDDSGDSGFGLSAALAIATSKEWEKRRRKILVNSLVRILYSVLPEPTDASNSLPDLMEQLLAQDSGTLSMANHLPLCWKAENAKTKWKGDRQPILHWNWQTHNDQTTDLYSTCNLSLVASNGVEVELVSQTSDDGQGKPVAVCDLSKFQWTLEGTTQATENTDGTPEEIPNIQSFWKIDSVSVSCPRPTISEIVSEEVFLEGKDVSLMGVLVVEEELPSHPRLFSKSVLSVTMVSLESGLSGSEAEKKAIGLALRTVVAYLDELVATPNLHLVLTTTSTTTATTITPEPNDESIPTLENSGESSMTLGDALKYYLKYYCSAPKETATKRIPSKFLSMGDSMATFGAIAATGTSYISPLGAAVSVAALAAKDGVAAAARKGKEVRMAHPQEGGSDSSGGIRSLAANRFGSVFGKTNRSLSSSETSTATAAAAAADTEAKFTDDKNGYKFGDVTRGLIGSIREKREQLQSSSRKDSTNENLEGSGNYLVENRGRFAGVAGGTAGAAAGMVVAGPIGAFAGSMLGSLGSQRALQKHEQLHGASTDEETPALPKLGDSFRNLVAKGKEASNRAKSESYRFGDFSRGLIASIKREKNEASEQPENGDL